ncbi:ubiquitin-like protein 4A [Ptychodera flava]|uniref:ubiquitin-like protein 4A n=1 Tax=Ptychodera flava TaxID=63121 RepID=UPI00396A2E8B
MLITVKILQAQGKECSIEVTATDSISSVKELIARELDVPVDQQRLVFRGKTLADGQSLGDYNIGPGTKLHLVVKRSQDEKSGNFQKIPPQTTALWDQLKPVLSKHFKTEDVDKVIHHFQKEFESSISNLSLDDLERIAIYNLERRQQDSDSASSSS